MASSSSGVGREDSRMRTSSQAAMCTGRVSGMFPMLGSPSHSRTVGILPGRKRRANSDCGSARRNVPARQEALRGRDRKITAVRPPRPRERRNKVLSAFRVCE